MTSLAQSNPLFWQRILSAMSLRTPLGSAVQMVSTPLARAAGAIPTVNFNLSDITFTAGMAKRAGSVFAGAPIVQGFKDASGTPDILSFPRGTLIAGYTYTNFDPYQGSIVFWWTPEYSSGGIASGIHYFVYTSSNYHFEYDYDNARFSMTVGGQTMTVSKAIVAGTKYSVSFSWNTNNFIDTAANYGRFSVDDVHTFGVTTQPTTSAPDATIYIGSNGTTGGNSGIIQGLCILRRVLWDGTYGVNVGNGDELNLIWAAGTGKDQALVLGSWDTVGFLPTNSTVGALVSGNGEMWSHPNDNTSQKLTDWCCAITYASSGWSTLGTPSDGPKDIAAAANKIYQGGYQFTTAADGDGIGQTKAGQTANADYVLRCVAHSSSADAITVQVYDETNSALIKDFDFGASSTVTAPGIALFSFELPTIARGAAADCVSFSVKIMGTAAAQVVYVHQCESLNNLLDNPSLDTGAVADPWIPYGWSNVGLDAGDSQTSSSGGGVIHSTGDCVQYNPSANGEGIYKQIAGGVAGSYLSVGCYGYTTVGATGSEYINGWSGHNTNHTGTLIANINSITGSWKLLTSVLRQITTAYTSTFMAYLGGGALPRYIDDAYMFRLTDVSLTCTPASQANSLESGGIRVDGRDKVNITTAALTASSGKVRFRWIPRHAAAISYAFKNGSDPRIFYASDGTANNVIDLHWSAANTVKLIVTYGGVSVNTTWDATGAIVAGTTYLVEVWYSGGTVYVDIDSVNKITRAAGAFSAALTALLFGSNSTPAGEVDAVYLAPA